MSQTSKKWYFRMNQQNVGPLSADQFYAQIRGGAVTLETFVWQEGMPKWKQAKEIETLNSWFGDPATESSTAEQPPVFEGEIRKSPFVSVGKRSKTHEDRSVLLALNPRDVDDRTGMLDPRKLRSARKEEEKARKTISRTLFQEDFKTHKTFYLVFLVLFLGAALGGYFLIDSKQVTSDLILSKIKNLAVRIYSPLPTLSELNITDYELLRESANAPLSEGPKLALASLKTKSGRPIVFVSGNIPNGVNLVLYIYAKNGAAKIRSPLAFAGKLAQSDPLTLDGQPLPAGEYFAVATEDEEQPEAAKKWLASIRTPPVIPQEVLSLIPQLTASRKIFGVRVIRF